MKILDDPTEAIKNQPSKVYKHRVWEDVLHKTILTKKMVYMAPPSTFEDNMDCKGFKRYNLMSIKDLRKRYLVHSKDENQTFNRKQHREYATDRAKNTPVHNKEYLNKKQKEHYFEFDRRFGVLSLTTNFSNTQMWNKYSANGQGFCVGLDYQKMFNFLGSVGSITYCKTLTDGIPILPSPVTSKFRIFNSHSFQSTLFLCFL